MSTSRLFAVQPRVYNSLSSVEKAYFACGLTISQRVAAYSRIALVRFYLCGGGSAYKQVQHGPSIQYVPATTGAATSAASDTASTSTLLMASTIRHRNNASTKKPTTFPTSVSTTAATRAQYGCSYATQQRLLIRSNSNRTQHNSIPHIIVRQSDQSVVSSLHPHR